MMTRRFWQFAAATALLFLSSGQAYAFAMRFEPPAGRVGETYHVEPIVWDAEYPVALELISPRETRR